MIKEYVNAALNKAHYEIIEDEEPYYGEIPELKGVWATGKTLEECRREIGFSENIEGWMIRFANQGMDIPAIDGYQVIMPGSGRCLS